MSDYDDGYLDAAGGARAAHHDADLARASARDSEAAADSAHNAALALALGLGKERKDNAVLKNQLATVKQRYQEVRVQNMDLASRVRGRGLMVDVLVDTLSKVDPGNERLDFRGRLEPSEAIPSSGGAAKAGNELMQRHWDGLRAEFDNDPLIRS